MYITKGIYLFPSTYPSKVSQERGELFSKKTNHDDWRIFNEAKDLEGNTKFDPEYYMIYQNKIIRIFLREHHSYNAPMRGIGRLITPNFGKDSQLRREYQQFLSWYDTWQPDWIYRY